MAKTILRVVSTVESKLPTLPLEDGQLIFVYDKKKIILDNRGVRTVYEQIQTIETEEQRNDLLAPIDSFYFVIETSILWRYTNGHWNQITTSPQEQIDRIATEGTKQVKAVRDEGQKVLQSIPEDFQTQMETKLNKQQGIENKGKVLVIGEDGNVAPGEVQSGGGDGIAIINTMSGESPLAIPDSAERVNKRLELCGKTDQVQTSGKNLFDPNNNYEDLVWIRNDGEIVGGSNARTSDYIPVEQGNYAFQFDIPNPNQMFVAGYNADRAFVKIVGIISKGKCIIKIDDIQIETIRLSYTRESTRIQLERSETQTPYEPYTGGKPSPSPEYPQEIKNSGKWNDEKQKYEVVVKITGKNLLNLQKEPDVKGLYQGWNVGNHGESALSIKDKGNNSDISGCYLGVNTDGISGNSVNWIVDNGVIKNNQLLVTTKPYVCMYPANDTIIKKLTDRFEIQYEYGSMATEYQPYKEQTLILTSERPITKWDKLIEQDGEIGWLYGTKKYTITGNELFQHGAESYHTGSSTDMFYVIPDATDSAGIMNDLSFVKGIWNYTDKESFCVNVNQLHVRLYNTRIGVSDDAAKEEKFKMYKAFMAKRYADGTPFEVYYKTTKSEFIPLPQSEQNAIRALKTYYPTTVITADGGELDPDIKVTYTADIKNYIDNKFGKTINAMQTKLLELESRV